MTQNGSKKILIFIVAAVCVLTIALALSFATQKTYSASVDKVNIGVSADKNAAVYVSGDGVRKTESGYTAKPGTQVTVSVVNEDAIFSCVTIGGTKYDTQVNVVTVPNDSENFDITVETREPFAEDKGSYFGNPYLISQEADVLALSKIFKGTAEAEDFARFGESAQTVARLTHGYFRLTTNLFISDESFSGLGSRSQSGYPFQGCFDFGGYAVTLGITRTSHVEEEFILNETEDVYIADYGFFSLIYGDGNLPCLVRNAQVGGFIAINTVNSASSDIENTRVNAGGLAGTSGKNVLLDGVTSQVSVSGYVVNASLYVGGVFGLCASNVEHWSNVSYEGLYSNVSGVTLGEFSRVNAGSFAGVVQNARINDFVVDVQDTTVIANSLNKKSGSCIAGGFVGSLVLRNSVLEEIGDPVSMTVKNTTLKLNGTFAVESFVNNSDASDKASIDPDKLAGNHAGAVAGGVIGTIYRDAAITDDNIVIKLSGNKFVSGESNDISRADRRLSVKASTVDASSSGALFAGGYTGYIFTDGVQHVYHDMNDSNLTDENGSYVFDCALDVTAMQNGVGPAYAGGLFGYNAYSITNDGKEVQFHVCSEDYDYNISAVQSATSSKIDNVLYDVAAGGFSSKIYPGYSAKDVVFELGNCNIRAYREAGSTAIGDIAAGGYTAMATNSVTQFGKHSSTTMGDVENFTLLFEENSTVQAACYSFDSDATNGTGVQSGTGNNVYAGGVVGLVIGYNNISNITAKYESKGGTPNEYFVHVIQNAVSGNDDLATEGFVGGMFGLVMDSNLTNLQLIGEETDGSLVYLESNNNPNTASVGGLIGAVWSWWFSNAKLVNGALVKNIHVAGKGYNTVSSDQYDIYVGGAIGISGNQNKGWGNNGNQLLNIVVDNCTIESIGENKMLTYAAGIVGGIWWCYNQHLKDSVVIDSSITSSSVSQKAYAAGVAGIAQKAYISGCAVIDTDVRAISPNNEASAFGIFSWAKDYYSVTGNYSNATIKAQGKSGNSWYAGIGHLPFNANDKNYDKIHNGNVFVAENAGTDSIYQNASRYPNATGAALYLSENDTNQIELENVDDTQKVYPMAYLTVGSGTTTETKFVLDVKSSDEKVATVAKNDDDYYYVTATGKGTAYVSAWCTVNGESYQLCTYPVMVQGGAQTTSFALNVTDGDGNALTDENVNARYIYEDGNLHYYYVKRLVGDPNTVGTFAITSIVDGVAGVFPVEGTLYDVAVKSSWADDESRVTSILANKGSKVEQSSFNGRATIATTGDVGARTKVSVSVKNSLSETVIMVLEYVVNGQTYGVITEFVPNEIVGIDLAPDSGTPAHDIVTIDGKTYFVYAPGDVVRFDAKIVRRFSGMREYVVETAFSGEGVTPNGTVVVSGDKETYEITCSTIDGNTKTTAYILVRKQVSVTPSLSGAVFTAEQKMIKGSTYEFSVSPQGGYGLKPTVSFTINGVPYDAEWTTDGIEIVYGGKAYTLAVQKSDVDGSYKFTMSAELTAAIANDADEITVNASFNKTYAYVFVANFGDNSAFRIEVAAGTPLQDFDLDDFDAWSKTLYRYGFDLQGFYLVSDASNLSDFGASFDEMRNSGTEYANGFLKFYARWTYSVVAERPESVEVKSSFSQGSLEDGYIIPVSEKNGFGFTLALCDGYVGSPRYDVYIRLENGTYVCVTELFEKDALENSFYASYAKLSAYASGAIYVKVYADDLEFYVGDGVKYDGNKLYSDGIFTLEYSVNYGENDDVKDVKFSFSPIALPKDTSLRLYYQKDGKATWAGGLVLDEETSEVSVAKFASMADGSALQTALRQGAKSEKFALVVTLPTNTDSFGAQGGITATVSVNGYEYVRTVEKYGTSAQSIEDKPSDIVPQASKDAVFYTATKHNVTVTGTGSVRYTVTDNSVDGVTDHRHQGSVYMFKAELTAGGAIGDATFDFIGTETVRTTTAVYFVATSGQSFSTANLVGYTLSLVEVRNAQQPSEGLVLFTQSF